MAAEKSFCLTEGNLLLKKDHAYYYQVQMQMKVCKVKYCDFVVWGKDGLVRQRTVLDLKFFDDVLIQVESFVKLCILPQPVSQWFTSQAILAIHDVYVKDDDNIGT